MTRISTLVASFVLVAAGLSNAQAAQPVYRMSTDCTAPTMPGKGSTRYDWDTYAALMKDYNQCLGEKTAKLGEGAKEKLEDVGNTVTDWADSAKGWFSR